MQTSENRKKRMISVKLDEEIVANLDSLAEKIDIPRGRLAVRIIHESLPEIKVLNETGILRWGSWLEWVISKVKAHAHFLERNETESKKVSLTLWLDESDVETLTTIGGKFLLTKAKFASNIITAVVPELKFINSLGLVDAVHWLEGLKEKMTKQSYAKIKQKGIKQVQ